MHKWISELLQLVVSVPSHRHPIKMLPHGLRHFVKQLDNNSAPASKRTYTWNPTAVTSELALSIVHQCGDKHAPPI